MATKRVSFVKVQRDSKGFTAVLASAVLEWLLIFLLFVDAIFSCLLKKFAHGCALRTPCLLCSRIDHILGNEKPGFRWDLFCDAHKLQISSKIFCRVHDKLADACGMCETCLFSSTTEKKSDNSMGYRFLAGKLGSDLDFCVGDPMINSLTERDCSCCHHPWRLRLGTPNKLIHNKSIGDEVAESDSPLSLSVEHSPKNLHDFSKKSRQRTFEVVRKSKLGKQNFDTLPHIGYTELKITSDTESEIPLSDDDDDDPQTDHSILVEDFVAKCATLDPPTIIREKVLSNDLTQEKLIHAMPEPSSHLIPNVELDVCVSYDLTSSAATIGHGLEELNWHQVEPKANPSAPFEVISVHDVPLSPEAAEKAVGETSGGTCLNEAVENEQTSTMENEKICQLEGDSIEETGQSLKIEQGLNEPTLEHETICQLEGGLREETGQTLKEPSLSLNEPAQPFASLLDLNDAYKLVVKNKGAQASSILLEQITKKDSSRVSEDLKVLLSKKSSALGREFSLTELSPRVLGQGEELRNSDASSSFGLQILQNRISIERNESGFESLDGSIVSEIEGESVVDRLKRQIEYDRKSMSALYKELEEERNAAAVAANQAMAMITRLQEEKATLQMEALQYLRMTEEQAEYDMEALQKANDLLAEKEREVQDLEAEIEIYREKFPFDPMEESIQDRVLDLNGEGGLVECPDVSCISNNASFPTNSSPSKNLNISNGHEKIVAERKDKNISLCMESLADIEDERLYISQCLKKLEQKLLLFSNLGINMDKPKGECRGKEANEVDDQENLCCSQGYIQTEEDGIMEQKDLSQSAGELPDGSIQFDSKENNHFSDSLTDKKTDLVSLENEVFDLNKRLKALEADQNFLEHVINSFQNGDGVQFIHEIALHL